MAESCRGFYQGVRWHLTLLRKRFKVWAFPIPKNSFNRARINIQRQWISFGSRQDILTIKTLNVKHTFPVFSIWQISQLFIRCIITWCARLEIWFFSFCFRSRKLLYVFAFIHWLILVDTLLKFKVVNFLKIAASPKTLKVDSKNRPFRVSAYLWDLIAYIAQFFDSEFYCQNQLLNFADVLLQSSLRYFYSVNLYISHNYPVCHKTVLIGFLLLLSSAKRYSNNG